MGVRRELVAETRARIVAAVVALHEEVGPRHTTIKGIAERAGVERLTVYRHFPDERSIYRACASCWLESHPPPDPQQWEGIEEGEALAQAVLGAMNSYYREGQKMLRQIYRDVDDIPALAEVVEGFSGYLEGLAVRMEAAWAGSSARTGKELSATSRHVLGFKTWDLLEGTGLTDAEKTALQLKWLRSAAG